MNLVEKCGEWLFGVFLVGAGVVIGSLTVLFLKLIWTAILYGR